MLCIKGNIFKHRLFGNIGKINIIKNNVALNRADFAAVVPKKLSFAVFKLFFKSNGALVNLRIHIHYFKHALCARKGRKNSVHLVCDLVNRLSELL